MCYLLNYVDVKEWKISEIFEKLGEINGLKLSECTISKLVFYNGNPIISGNGVYIFYRMNGVSREYTYVGKCSSRTFVERIPAHFNIKRTGWFNSYLRNLVNEKRERPILVREFQDIFNNKEDFNELLKKEAYEALNNHYLILINFEVDDLVTANSETKKKKVLKLNSKKITLLETILRVKLTPLNKISNDSNYTSCKDHYVKCYIDKTMEDFDE